MLKLNLSDINVTSPVISNTLPLGNLAKEDEDDLTPLPGEPRQDYDFSSPALITVPSSAPYYVKAIDSGKVWSNNGSGVTINYKFWDSLPSYYSSGSSEANNFQAFTNAQKAATLKILDMLSSIANVTFNEVSSDSSAQLGFAQANLGSGVGAWAYYPGSSSTSGDVWTNNYYASSTQNVTEGTYGFMVLAHEIGHAMGLAHPFDSAPTLPSGEDSSRYTIMSYTWPFYSESYMIYDIAALQVKYGANMNHATGNNNYVLDSGAAYAIWDAGGTDTLDGSALSSSMTLNLNAGTMSSVGKTENIGIAYNVTIENVKGGNGSDTIYGNDADNHIWGNNGNDKIYSSAGNDILEGGAGTDTVIYSFSISDFLINLVDSITVTLTNALMGFDTLISIEKFTFGSLTYNFSDLQGYAGGSGGGDTGGGQDDATLTGTSNGETLIGGTGDDTIYGKGGYDKLYGGDGNDVIHGGSYLDKIYGEDGNDTLYGYERYDTIYGGAGNDTLYGGDYYDRLYGEDGNDILHGDEGNDYLYGGNGDDTFYGGTGNDYIYGDDGTDTAVYERAIQDYTINLYSSYTKISNSLSGNDTLRDIENFKFGDTTYSYSELQDYLNGGSSNTGNNGSSTLNGTDGYDVIHGGLGDDIINGYGSYDRLYGGGGNDTLHGGDYYDRLYGEDGNDNLYGDDGNDYLYGGTGNDTLNGGAGNDYLYGDSGNDTLIAGLGRDTLYGKSGSDIFAFDALDNNTDYIKDFTLTGPDADKLNITDILSGFDSSKDIHDFVQINVVGSTQMDLMINQDGAGNDWVKAAIITGLNFSGVTLDNLTANGQLITGEPLL